MSDNESFDEFSAQLDRLSAAFLPRLTLKSFKHAAFLSEETNAFSATVYFDGKRVGHAKNEGHGGSTDIFASKGAERERLTAAEAEVKAHDDAGPYCGLDYIVDAAVERRIRAKEDQKALRGGKIAWTLVGSPNEITSVKWPTVAKDWPQSKPEFMAEAKTAGWISDPSAVTFLNDTVSLRDTVSL